MRFPVGSPGAWVAVAWLWSAPLAVAAAGPFQTPAPAAPSAPEKAASDLLQGAIEKGKAAVAAGSYADAIAVFEEAERSSGEGSALWFYQALAYQRWAEAEPAERDRRRARAEELYRSFLEVQPGSAAARNNLGKLYELRGDREQAAAFYLEAAAVDEKHAALYRQSYARVMDRAGSWREADRVYTDLVKQEPTASDLHEEMLERYLRSDGKLERGDGLLEYLWQILDAGQAPRAGDAAIQALEVGGWSSQATVELLTVAAASLSRQGYDPRRFLETEAAARLERLLGSEAVAAGVKELLDLHRQQLDAGRYAWWRDRGSSREDPKRGVWPVDAFRALSRSLGEKHRRFGDYELASGYLQLAADLVPGEVDPAALRALIHLYIEQGATGKVTELAREYESGLLQAKGRAYRESHTEKAFELHRTLGELYGTLGRWGDGSEVTSAIFQLERARQVAGELVAEQPSGESASAYRFTPELAGLLARGYEATGKPEKGVEVRIEAAEVYVRTGDVGGAERVLSPVRAEAQAPKVSREYESRLTRVVRELPRAERVPPRL